MAQARLRRTFAYSTDSDTDDHDLDEAEQEELITTLSTKDAHNTLLYRRVLLSLPLALLLLALTRLASSPLTSILAVTSLGLSAFVLERLPLAGGTELRQQGILEEGEEDEWIFSIFAPAEAEVLRGLRGRRQATMREAEASPLEKWAVWLNAVLGLLLMVSSRAKARGMRIEEWLSWGPFVVLLFVLAARWALKPVDVAQLEGLRYRYKGA